MMHIMARCKLMVALLLVSCSALRLAEAGTIGVNYGTLGNNLPSPAQVAQLLLQTSLRSVKIYNTEPAIMQAFANTGIKLIVGVGTESIPLLASSPAGAQAWVATNVAAYMPATAISAIAVGNEVLMTQSSFASQLVPAMINVHTALVSLKLDGQVKVGTPHNLQVLQKSFPPSAGTFRTNITDEVKALLAFLSSTGGPIMVNFYPYFAYRDDPKNVSLNYALFQQPDAGVTDPNTGLHYTNMLDAQLDSVYSAMERLGYHNIPILISETGWPSGGDAAELAVGPSNAQIYNRNLMKYVTAGAGTPLRPGTSVDAYIFALFNENMKPGLGSERNFGLFNPDKTAVYNLGLLTGAAPAPYLSPVSPSPPIVTPSPVYSPPIVTPSPVYSPPIVVTPPPVYSPPVVVTPSPVYSSPPPSSPVTTPVPVQSGNTGKTWCVAKAGANTQDTTNALNFACGEGGADCTGIQASGQCYNPNTLLSHASYAFNAYYQKTGRNYWNCYFGGTGVITITDPSYSGCNFL